MYASIPSENLFVIMLLSTSLQGMFYSCANNIAAGNNGNHSREKERTKVLKE